jgi:hypothetical protein
MQTIISTAKFSIDLYCFLSMIFLTASRTIERSLDLFFSSIILLIIKIKTSCTELLINFIEKYWFGFLPQERSLNSALFKKLILDCC